MPNVFILVLCLFRFPIREIFVKIFDLVKIRSVFCLYFTVDWSFLTKFCSSDPSLSRSILTSLHLKSETSAHAQLLS